LPCEAFTKLLLSISILLFSFYSTVSIVLYGAVEHWMSGALVSPGDMIWYDTCPQKQSQLLF